VEGGRRKAVTEPDDLTRRNGAQRPYGRTWATPTRFKNWRVAPK